MNENWKLVLECLTPVQVGSGELLHKNLDFIPSRKGLDVVDQEACFRAIATSLAELPELNQGLPLEDLVRVADLPPDQSGNGYQLAPLADGKTDAHHIEQVRAHYKDAFFRPTIPGSSLKGSIRTALFAVLAQDMEEHARNLHLPNNNRGRASQKNTLASRAIVENQLSPDAPYGKAPNFDLMRALHVGDILFDSGNLALADIRWSNLRFGKAGWRDMGSGKTIDNWQHAHGIHAEVLQPGCASAVILQLDRFLLQDPKAQVVLKARYGERGGRLFGSFDRLRDHVNQHSLGHLNKEIAWFQQYGITGAESVCRKLLRQMGDEPDAIYLRLGWGSGWRGMTGDWLSEGQLDDMRKLYRLGRDGAPFPKTRRLAVQGEPCLPLGWVRILDAAASAKKLTEIEQQREADKDRCPWVDHQIGIIAQQDRVPETQQDNVLFGKKLANAWQALEDEELKAGALADIKQRWRKAGRWEDPVGNATKYAKSIYTKS